MKIRVMQQGTSRSFPTPHPLLERGGDPCEGLLLLGSGAGELLARLQQGESYPFIAIELDHECLGVHSGEVDHPLLRRLVGFARFRQGRLPPSDLVELVRKPFTAAEACAAAKAAFEESGLKVAVCNDFPGRIVNRLIRPVYNAVLRRLDEGLASAGDLDKTLRLGLGYPEGIVDLLERAGLEAHYEDAAALYAALGEIGYLPARRARVAYQRASDQHAGRRPVPE
jgi:3-hydroxybutyryl-CoA dehydrogenase